MRIALGVEYDGAAYNGWQRQKHAPETIQAHVERALGFVANHPVDIVCAGRTDAGVHGVGQVVHFDSPAERDERAWIHGCNAKLPDTIAIKWARDVDASFHARFEALSRRYRYVIYNHPVRPGIGLANLTWNFRPLDHQLMHDAAQCLVGEHNFSSFRAVACQSKSPVRDIHYINVYRRDRLVVIDIQANAFLQHMVRNIAGVLMAVGCRKKSADWVQSVLDAKDRTQGGVTAPPHGLYFMGVDYPDHYGIPVPESNVPFMAL